MASHNLTTISIHRETYDRVKRMKRGGESFDDLVERMAEQYNPADSTTGVQDGD